MYRKKLVSQNTHFIDNHLFKSNRTWFSRARAASLVSDVLPAVLAGFKARTAAASKWELGGSDDAAVLLPVVDDDGAAAKVPCGNALLEVLNSSKGGSGGLNPVAPAGAIFVSMEVESSTAK